MEAAYHIHSGMTLDEIDQVNARMNEDFAKCSVSVKSSLEQLAKGIEEQQREWKEINEEVRKRNNQSLMQPLRELADATCGFFLGWLPSS